MPLVKAWTKRASLKLISAKYKVIYKNKRNRWSVQSRYAPTYWITARRADGQILEGFVKFKLRNMTLLGANDLANYQVITDWES